MYVIFPAEEVVELTLGGIVVNHHHHHHHHHHLPTTAFTLVNQQVPEQHHHPPSPPSRGNISQTRQSKHDKKRRKSVRSSKKQQQQQQQPQQQQSQQQQEQQQQEETEQKQQQDKTKMASGGGGGGGEVTLRDITHPALNEALKAHNSVTFKLVRTVSDFTQQLSQIYEQHAEEMQLLVSNFRKRNGELRKERPACPSSLFHTWETLLQEVEIDSQAHSDIASVLGRQVSRPLLERSFHRKIQSRKVFTHRESYETILTKTEDKLSKCRQDYKNGYMAYLSNPSTATLAAYFDAHNAYVQQLHATNGMLDQYHHDSLPQLLQELEDVYSDLCSTLSDAVLQGAEIISARAVEQSRRYDGLSSQCRAVAGPTDLAHFVRSLPMPQTNPHHPSLRHNFVPPHPPPPPENMAPDGTPLEPAANDPTLNPPPPLKDEIVVDRLASVPVRSRYEALKKEASELDVQIKQLQDALDTLLRIQQRSLESSLYNKANELQEDISMKRFDLRVAQIHLGAVKAQKELFASKVESASDSNRERKMSSSSTGSMKNKWLKAFKSLKTTGASNGAAIKEAEKKNQMYHAVSTIMSMRKNGKDSAAPNLQTANLDPSAHQFQEYTYKKITPCDVCSQVLRGHTRQGLKCRICKLNVHVDCQEKVGRCQPKSRLLRRQKSTSEIETRVQEPVPDEEMNTVHFGPEKPDRPTRLRPIDFSGATVEGGASAQDTNRRRKMFAGMKSLSVFGGRSGRADSPSSNNSRSISLPESRSPGSAVGTRPFGQPLCLSQTINENGSVVNVKAQNRLSK